MIRVDAKAHFALPWAERSLALEGLTPEQLVWLCEDLAALPPAPEAHDRPLGGEAPKELISFVHAYRAKTGNFPARIVVSPRMLARVAASVDRRFVGEASEEEPGDGRFQIAFPGAWCSLECDPTLTDGEIRAEART